MRVTKLTKVLSSTFGFAAIAIIVIAIVWPDPDPIIITMASSITKREWNENAIAEFNNASKSDSSLKVDGRPVQVEMILEPSPLNPEIKRYYRSPTQVADTVNGIIEPVILSPANRPWLAKLKADWRDRYGAEIFTEAAPPLLSTPMVVAMWESRGIALGCWPEPGPSCTWKNIFQLAKRGDGWGSLGHPNWGDPKFAYATVGESDVATLTVVMLCAAGLGVQPVDLRVSQMEEENGCGDAIGAIEDKKPRAAPSSPVILTLMEENGPEYLEMVTTYEKEVIAFNRRTAGKVREPLIAAYPQDGTIVADHPFAILDGTPWVTPEQVEAARIFREFLFTEDQQEALMETGLRPADSRVKIAPIDRNNGVNPGAVSVILEVPDVLAIERAVEVWDAVEKQADIALVFDRSGSMRGSKINAAAQGANAFLDSMDNEDWLMWLPFDNNPGQIHQGINGKVRESLKNIINSEIADGGTSLFDSIGLAYQTLETRRRVRGDSRRYGIVVLSDGEDTESNSFSLAQLEAMMRPTERDPTGIQIHAIGIGDDVDENVLTKLATASQGAYGTPDLENIEAIYRQISKYF